MNNLKLKLSEDENLRNQIIEYYINQNLTKKESAVKIGISLWTFNNMCEIKIYNKSFSMSKSYYDKILERIDALVEMIPPNATVHSTLITTSGLKRNEYSGAFVKVIILDDLFCRK